MFFTSILIAFSKQCINFLYDFFILLYCCGAALYILLVLSANISTFGDDLMSKISDFIFSWKLLFNFLNLERWLDFISLFQNYLILLVDLDDILILIQNYSRLASSLFFSLLFKKKCAFQWIHLVTLSILSINCYQ